MPKVLKSDGSISDAYVEKDLGASYPELWITVFALIDAASLTQWISDGHNQSLLALFGPGSVPQTDTVLVTSAPAWSTGWGGTGGIPAGDIWVLLEFRHVTSGSTELYINGSLVVAATDLSGVDSRIVQIGQQGVDGNAPSVVYYDDVKVGTTRGGSDLFSDDFESGGLTAWTTQIGDVSVVEAPIPPPDSPPDAPVLISATAGNAAVDLVWTTPFDGGSAITGYNVYRSLVSGSETLLTMLGVTNAYHDSGLTNDVTYYYKVSAVNAFGESPLSNELAAVPNPTPRRFRIGHQWRFVVTELDMTTLTFLDRLAENRTVVYTLNAPAVATGNVPSDNPQVNILAGDGDPYVSYSNRLLFGFRREGGTPPWVCRFAGILMQLEDAASTDVPSSLYIAYDPWQYLLSRPVRTETYALPGPGGLTFDSADWTLDQIAQALIDRTVVTDGSVYTDIIGGTIESIGFTGKITFQQGTSVGDALTQICNLGLCDIWFSPLYDPVGNPGIIALLNVFIQQGATRNNAIFAWDAPSKSLIGISRLLDGAQLANEIQFYNGQGGPPVTLQTGATSIAKYGKYWAQQFFPAQVATVAVESMAAQQLLLRQLGRRTVAINPAPERSPDPFTEYFLGDLCPIYATKRLRQTLPAPGEPTNYTRIYGIPVTIPNDAPETIAQLLTSPDGFTP